MIQLSPLGTYETGIFAASAAEIVAFDPISDRLFVTNTAQNLLTILNASDPNQLNLVKSIDLSVYGGGINSVSVKNGLVAVAIESDPKQNPGKVVFFDTAGTFLNSVAVGALPDMVTFSPDGTKLLVANEGEPNDSYTIDPEGSVSIIDLSGGVAALTQANVKTAAFTGLIKQDLLDQGVRVFGPGSSAAQDFEPEYIAVSSDSTTAWVTLQENNALAKINLATGAVEILPLGYKDHSLRGNELDASNRDGTIDIQNWPVLGMYLPDSIATYESKGTTYVVMANEGDSRVYDGFDEEARIADVVLDPTAFPNAADLQRPENLGRLKITKTLGDTDRDGDYDQLYAFGARSFSIRDAYGNLVFDSGADLERITAHFLPNDFNAANDENDSFDDRSDDKGPEPEALAVGQINGRTYAFVGLERVGGIAVYDITNPTDAEFVQYINTRNFSGDIEASIIAGTSGDVSPEGFSFIAATDSPTGEPLLAVANEISGTTSLYRIHLNQTAPAGSIAGTEGNNSLKGTDNADSIYALGGADQISAWLGNDTVYAGAGDDQVTSGDGDDLILGEVGNDRLKGDQGNDLIWAGLGNDEIEGTSGNDNLYGGEGNDHLKGGSNSDYLDGGVGNDVVEGGDGDDSLKGGKGNNQLLGGSGSDFFDLSWGAGSLDGGSGNDTLTLAYRSTSTNVDLAIGKIAFVNQTGSINFRSIEKVIGTKYADSIQGDDRANHLEGLDGKDKLVGAGGDDVLLGEDHKDNLSGDKGRDTLNGGNSSDQLQGGADSDRLIGGRGTDQLFGGTGKDILIGVDPTQVAVGIGEVDQLQGGTNGDRFVLGDAIRAYYDDGISDTSGVVDYAHLKDFKRSEGDVIQLHGNAAQYVLGSINNNTGLFLKSAGSSNELIAIVNGLSLSTQLTSSAFQYV